MVQLKYILSFAALLAYVGAESPPVFAKPGEIDGLCGGTDKIQCGQDLECSAINDSEGYCWKRAKEGESCGGMVNRPSCAEGLHCKYPKRGTCLIPGSMFKPSKERVGRRNRCKTGSGPPKEGTECDNDIECGRGLECVEISDQLGTCVKK
jgi:hypothetical protein